MPDDPCRSSIRKEPRVLNCFGLNAGFGKEMYSKDTNNGNICDIAPTCIEAKVRWSRVRSQGAPRCCMKFDQYRGTNHEQWASILDAEDQS